MPYNMSLAALVREHGGIAHVPADELELEGFLRVGGRVVAIEDLGEEEMVRALGIPELENETYAAKFAAKVREAEARVDKALQGPVGAYVDEELREYLLGKGNKLARDQIERSVDFAEDADDIVSFDVNLLPGVAFIEAANRFVEQQGLEPSYATAALKKVAHDAFDAQMVPGDIPRFTVDYISEGVDSFFTEAQEDFTASAEFINRREELAAEFTKKHDDIQIGGGAPFLSWSFRKIFLKEEDPQDFWGKSISDLRRKFIDEFDGDPAAVEFADAIYGYELEAGMEDWMFSDYPGEGIIGKGALEDAIPDMLEEFERHRAETSAAEAYVHTGYYVIDDDYLASKDVRDFIRKMDAVEFREQLDSDLETYAFLRDHAPTRGKWIKVARLCKHDPKFEGFVRSYIEEGPEFVAQIPSNEKELAHMRELGIDTDVWLNGIPEVEFAMRGGRPVDVSAEYAAIYKERLEQALTGGVLHNVAGLEQRLVATLFRKHELEVTDENGLLAYARALDDKDALRTVCSVIAAHAERKPNIKDHAEAAAVAFHMRQVGRSLRGGAKATERGQEEEIFTIKLADKNPFQDVDIGNDGGCCIGVYDGQQEDDDDDYDWTQRRFLEDLRDRRGIGEVTSNGMYMPFYLRDVATQFVEVYRGNERVGMSLLFAGETGLEESSLSSVLVTNSVEFSGRMRENRNRKAVEGAVHEYIERLRDSAGFEQSSTSSQLHNTFKDPYGTYAEPFVGRSVFRKISGGTGEEFYSDIWDTDLDN